MFRLGGIPSLVATLSHVNVINSIVAICTGTALLIAASSSGSAQVAVRGFRSGSRATHVVNLVPRTTGATHIAARLYSPPLQHRAADTQCVISATFGVRAKSKSGAAADCTCTAARRRSCDDNLESMTIVLVPRVSSSAGVVDHVKRKREHSVDWTAQLPASRAPPSGR